ncbi:transcription initiation factor TFIID subunit 4-like isoform X2 [Eublepharis macularius]|uniref:Transcription initiation factor TFIID subunit 4-like isoform X2 n=1 Tax=Eublepharis macularius TaxID=481883 RepID=A0AA97LGZ6_EUBMA|nr:transcription initiation factor TFIID subunit 4-like isoform X2 [Eublepharis macularius]
MHRRPTARRPPRRLTNLVPGSCSASRPGGLPEAALPALEPSPMSGPAGQCDGCIGLPGPACAPLGLFLQGDAKVLPVRDRTDLQRPRVRVTLWKAASHCNRGHLHNHPSRLRLHHAAVGRREGLLPLLRAAGRALHHAGAHGHRATPGGRARRRPARAPGAEVGLPAAEPLLRAPAPAGRGGAGGLLPGARRRLQRPGGVLELPGRLLLLLHLPLHHRPGGLRPGRAAGPALPPSLQDLRHGLPATGTPGHAPAAPDLPQGCRTARPLRHGLAPAGATLRGPRAHPGGPGASLGAGACRKHARAGPTQRWRASQLRLHQQVAREPRLQEEGPGRPAPPPEASPGPCWKDTPPPPIFTPFSLAGSLLIPNSWVRGMLPAAIQIYLCRCLFFKVEW